MPTTTPSSRRSSKSLPAAEQHDLTALVAARETPEMGTQTDPQADPQAGPNAWPHPIPVLNTVGEVVGETGGYPAHIKSATYLSIADVLWATRTLLSAVQANHTMIWPFQPTREEGEVAMLVKTERARRDADVLRDLLAHETPHSDDLLAAYPRTPMVGANAIAHEVLLHAFTITPMTLVGAFGQLGIDANLTRTDDLIASYALLHRTEWFEPIRAQAIHLTSIHALHARLGDEKFTLLLELGYNESGLTKAAEHPERIDIPSLRTLLALRRPQVRHYPLTGVTGVTGPGITP